MNRNRKILFCLIAAVVVGIIFSLATLWREPRIEGKSLSAWLEENSLNACCGGTPVPKEPLQKISAQALPHLLRMIQTKDSWLMAKLDELDDKLDWVKLDLKMPRDRREMGALGFELLGASAASAIPALTNLLEQGEPQIAPYAVAALGSIGPSAAAAVLRAMSHTNYAVRATAAYVILQVNHPDQSAVVNALIVSIQDANDYVRNTSFRSLGMITNQNARVIPVFLKNLESRDQRTRNICLWGLGNGGTNAAIAIPAILHWMNDQLSTLAAGRALAKIDLPLAVSKLSELTSHTNRAIRNISVKILGELGSNAVAALPALATAYGGATNEFRSGLWRTIQQIDTNAPARLGLQPPEPSPAGSRDRGRSTSR